MSLSLYLDDCAYSHLLTRLLREAGHTVVTPAEARLTGKDDETHLRYALQNGLLLLTKNPSDFEELHRAQPEHPGVLAVYQDNDIERDMSDAEIVQALAQLERVFAEAKTPLAGQFHCLNAWRGAGERSTAPHPKKPGRGKKRQA